MGKERRNDKLFVFRFVWCRSGIHASNARQVSQHALPSISAWPLGLSRGVAMKMHRHSQKQLSRHERTIELVDNDDAYGPHIVARYANIPHYPPVVLTFSNDELKAIAKWIKRVRR